MRLFFLSARNAALAALATAFLATALPGALTAQTDFYNLDKDRPLRVEDAYTTKRYAFERKGSPLTLAQDRDGTVRYRPELELKYGLLPGLDVSAGAKLGADRPALGETRRVDTELELSSLLNLTVETRWLPALGFRVTGHVPVEGDHGTTVELRGIATRTLGGPVRAHGCAAARWATTQPSGGGPASPSTTSFPSNTPCC
jgi:hypothetical protein